jgi:hypothetical protein
MLARLPEPECDESDEKIDGDDLLGVAGDGTGAVRVLLPIGR